MFKPIHTAAFDLAFQFIAETNENIFLTGKAGTGKTTFLKYLKESNIKNMAIAAPTGVAAINAGGVTLHSMFQLPFGPFIPGNNLNHNAYNTPTLISQLRLNRTKIDFFNSLELLVIDEVSMVSSYLIDAIDAVLRFVRHRRDLLFGGVQVLFIGDLYQLQPVVKPEEWQILNRYYSSIFFFDSHALRGNLPVMIELNEIFRQKDEHFINILNGIRDNNISAADLATLNKRLNRNFIPEDDAGYITLTTHNNQAETINRLKLKRLPKKEEKFIADIEGEFPDHMLPAEKELVLKENAQVMFIKNDNEDKKFYNGKIGIVDEIGEDQIIIRCGENLIHLGKHKWENIVYNVDSTSKMIKPQVVGTFSQFPLRLAWAITIHKSQGLTFEKVVIDAENAFVKGQVYVALSRATTLEGMVLTSPVNDRFLGAHENLKTIHDSRKGESDLRELYKTSREKFIHHQLFSAFTFKTFVRQFNQLKKILAESNLNADEWFTLLYNKERQISGVADKFEIEMRRLLEQNPAIEENEKLQQRVRDASVYFSGQLKELTDILINHPIRFNNRRDSRKPDEILESISETLNESFLKLKLCAEGFSMDRIRSWKKNMPEPEFKIPSVYHNQKKGQPDKDDLYERFVDLRERLSIEESVPAYQILSNKTIKEFCSLLPGDPDTLLTVSGFGRKKLESFGEQVLKLISEYCNEKGIAVKKLNEEEIVKENYSRSQKLSPTVLQTIELFKSGNKISAIAETRKLAESTIEGHLSVGIKNKLIDINEVLTEEEIREMSSLFENVSKYDVTAVRVKSNNKYSFGKLKMVQSWILNDM